MNCHRFCRHKWFLLCMGSCYSMSTKQLGMLAKLGHFRMSARMVIQASLTLSIFYWPLSFQRRRNGLVFSSRSPSVPSCLIHRLQACSRETSIPQGEPPPASQPGTRAPALTGGDTPLCSGPGRGVAAGRWH